jgi:predicted nuclease of predicted toxin-antitoxin system
VVTADSDFVAMLSQTGPPPRLIHIERCDFPFRAIEELLRQNAIRISEFEKDPRSAQLILRAPPLSPPVIRREHRARSRTGNIRSGRTA